MSKEALDSITYARIELRLFVKRFRKMSRDEIADDIEASIDDILDLNNEGSSFGAELIRKAMNSMEEAKEAGKIGGLKSAEQRALAALLKQKQAEEAKGGQNAGNGNNKEGVDDGSGLNDRGLHNERGRGNACENGSGTTGNSQRGTNCEDDSAVLARPVCDSRQAIPRASKKVVRWSSPEDFSKDAYLAADGKYSPEIVASFVDYWTESGANGKMRVDYEKVFDMGRRLATSARLGYGTPSFTPPTMQDVLDYSKGREIPDQWATEFFAHYKAVGWMSGKTKIVDWKAKLLSWCNNQQQRVS